eukprot:8323165-Lingulodinium_polyedra.AAC.1
MRGAAAIARISEKRRLSSFYARVAQTCSRTCIPLPLRRAFRNMRIPCVDRRAAVGAWSAQFVEFAGCGSG